MEKYEVLDLLGEGSYGVVLKCRHLKTGLEVAVKKFIGTEEESGARKVALREIRMLRKLHHPNLVTLLEVFRRKKRFHLVFQYMSCSLLQEIEAQGSIPESTVRKYMYQILQGVNYCHCHNIIHRDIKPENILISELGIVKICDFGFARFSTANNEPFTDYVATRWYRAPELLVGARNYGRGVDIWALGCILIEMLTGEPLFPGNSDLDQLYLITKLLGSLPEIQRLLEKKYGNDVGGDELITLMKTYPQREPLLCLRDSFPGMDSRICNFASRHLCLDPNERMTSEKLLQHRYFTCDMFLTHYIPELEKKMLLEQSRMVSVSDLPCPMPTLANYSSLRKPSIGSNIWNFNLINEEDAKEDPLYVEIISKRKPQSESVISYFSYKSQSKRSSVNKNEEVMDAKEGNKLPRDMPRINMEFKRNMMPSSQTYLKPIKGRLFYDKNLTLPCSDGLFEKPHFEGIYLPLIKTIGDNKNENKETRHLKRKSPAEITKSQDGGT